jgi:Transposase DDE domain
VIISPAQDKGRKRNIATDCLGLLLVVIVTAANVQDRDAAHRLLALLRERFSTISLVWADGGYAGRLVTWAKDVLNLAVAIVKRPTRPPGSSCYPADGSWSGRLAGPPPAPGQRLRTPTSTPRGHGVVGRRGHHDPPTDPRACRNPTPATLGWGQPRPDQQAA